MTRVPVAKTYKLYVGGRFPRSESGRTYEVESHNVALGSRKDVRDAVRAARGAVAGWSGASAYNRGQVLYRVAELLEARAGELAGLCSGPDEVAAATDRIVWYAGWTDKLASVLGGANPVAGPYVNYSVPEPTGVVGIVAPPEPALLGLVSRLAPVLAGANTAVVIASEAHPRAAVALAEVLATSDVPAGVVNVITGRRAELAPVLAAHLDVDALDLNSPDAELERAAADNVKRVVHGRGDGQSLWEVSSFVELKTVWHPMGT